MRLPQRFFFYGTLSEGMDNPVIAAVRPKLAPGRPAWTRGALHAIPERDGWYPALVEGMRRVEGTLHDLTDRFTAADLALLDRYEAFDPARPDTCDYVRAEVEVEAACGWRGTADAYLYTRALPRRSRAIAEPSFARFLAANGFRSLAPRD